VLRAGFVFNCIEEYIFNPLPQAGDFYLWYIATSGNRKP
jgi:hypothetical protein